MPDRREPFAFALDALRRRLRSGAHVLGEQLMVAVLARELGLSSTPIREALSRLAGEGLIEDRRGAGYFAWRSDAVDLVELYDLQATYLVAATQRSPVMSSVVARACEALGRASAEGEVLARTELLFEAVISSACNRALLRAHHLLADRLAPARRAETAVLGSMEPRLETLARAAREGLLTDFIAAAEAYHQPRRARAAEIVAAMRSLPPPAPAAKLAPG